MEPVTLGVIIAALAAKALERAGDEAVDAGFGAMGKIVEALRRRFAGSEDSDGEAALDRLADAPDSPSRVSALAELVDDRAAKSPGLREELEALMREARDAGVDVDSISQVAHGNQIVQNADINDSQVNISQSPPPRHDG